MAVDDRVIAEIIERVLRVTAPERIILFGSAAAGEMGPDSDIDLLILEAALHDPREKSVKIRKELRGLGYPFDIIVMSSAQFEESKDIIGGISHPANKYGKVIYEAA